MADPDLPQLQRAIAAEKARYLDLRAQLVEALAGTRPGADSLDMLLSCTEEFGADAALDKAEKSPASFGLAISPGGQLRGLLSEGLASSLTLDDLVAQREKIMRDVDPGRPPIYLLQGREFRLDVEAGTMTYLDDPGNPVALTVEVVHTKDQPDPGREPPGKRKQRGRSL